MVKVADHHTWTDADYKPTQGWSADTYVQWGSSGIVLGENPYSTAFFEAFPPKSEDAGGFLRGEGKTIADAEADCWAKYEKQSSCKHLWGREKYTNGGQMCRHCRAFRSGVIKPVFKFGEYRKPLNMSWEADSLRRYEEGDEATRRALAKKPARVKHYRLMQLRRNLFGIEADT